MKKQILFLFSILLFSLTLISAVPPVTITQQFASGYIIEDSPQTYLKENQDYVVNFFVYNISNGVVIDNSSSSCVFYLANSSGGVLTFGDATYDTTNKYWSYNIGENNFSIGDYFYGIKCQDTDLGGAIVGRWEVTPSGFNPSIPQAMMYGIILFILLTLFIGSFIWFNNIEWGNYTNSEGVIVEVTRNRTKKTALFFVSYILMLSLLFVGKSMALNFMLIDDTSFFFDTFFMILLVSIAPVTIAVASIIILTTIADTKLQEAIFRGLEIRK